MKTVGCAERTIRPPGRRLSQSNAAHAVSAPHVGIAGFSYVEVLVAVSLIVIALVPALDALIPGMAGSGVHENVAEDHYQLVGKLEQVLTEPFGQLNSAANAAGGPTTPTSYSDLFNYADGRQIARNVFIARYDADNADGDDDPFTDTDDGLLWVQVVIPGTGMRIESLVSEYD